MSWEIIDIKQIKCFCGKGNIKQIIKDDDWNRVRIEEPTIECEECSKKYVILKDIEVSKQKHESTKYCYLNKETNEKINIDLE